MAVEIRPNVMGHLAVRIMPILGQVWRAPADGDVRNSEPAVGDKSRSARDSMVAGFPTFALRTGCRWCNAREMGAVNQSGGR